MNGVNMAGSLNRLFLSIALIAVISSALSSKSKTARFSSSRPTCGRRAELRDR